MDQTKKGYLKMRLDRPDLRVREYLSQFTADQPLLPLTHLTNMYGFRSIMTGMTLDPTDCSVFREKLLYLFYGRPAYRAMQSPTAKLKWNVPVGFILKPEAIDHIKRVLPFDSGAFAKDLYSDVFSRESKVQHFMLEPNLESAAVCVKAFFGNNANYFRGNSEQVHELDNFDFELQGMEYLSRLPGVQAAKFDGSVDERASAIEVQVEKPITLDDALLGMIVPETMMASKHFKKAIETWNLSPDRVSPYVEIVGPGSEAWVGIFYEKVRELYENHGYL
ncbi:hypothetical protein [uncultured Litoreibacter sp.]|uniref:hypothetical protein n=1 Tax=uncultured Litoreibacter sp. TaxID=1392394 RepID=UPI002601D303|nr:hypothetical protein [uncultured Litoreibacter sp.]